MTNIDRSGGPGSAPLAPPPPPPDEITAFRRWLADYAEVGDPVTALVHYRHLHSLLGDLQAALGVLRDDVVDRFGRGTHHIDGAGAFTVRRGAKRYIVAKQSDDPVGYRRLLRDVTGAVPEGEDPLPVYETVWKMGPGDCRWTAVKNLGLNPNDYREADGWSHSIELL